MLEFLPIAVAGGVGAVARYMLDGWLAEKGINKKWKVGGGQAAIPLSTLIINAIGSLLLGILVASSLAAQSPMLLAALGTGFCGGFTTFSTASLEVATMLTQRRSKEATALAILMLLVCVAAASLGMAVKAGF